MPAGVTNAQGTTEYLGAAQHDAQMADHVTALTKATPGILPEVALAIAHDPSFTYHDMYDPRPDNAFHVAHGIMGLHMYHQLTRATIPSGPSNLDGPVGQGAPTGGPIGPPQQQPSAAGQPNGPEGMGIASQNPTGLLGQVTNAVSSTATDPTSDWDILHDSLYAPANNAVNEGLTQGFHGISTAFQDANLIGANWLGGGNQGTTNDILNQEGKGLTDALGAAAQGMNWVKTAAELPSKIGTAGEAAANTALGLGGSYKQNQQALAMSNDQQIARLQGLPIIHQIQQYFSSAMNIANQEYRAAQTVYARTGSYQQVSLYLAGSLGPQAIVAVLTGGLGLPEEVALRTLDETVVQLETKQAMEGLSAQETAELARLKVGQRVNNVTNALSKGLGPISPAGGVNFARHLLSAPALMANYAGAEFFGHTFYSKIWSDAQNAQTWSKSMHGTGYATIGRGVASQLAPKGSAAYNTISGVTDFIASWGVIPDPFAAAGRMTGAFHSVEGLLKDVPFLEKYGTGFGFARAAEVYNRSLGFRMWVRDVVRGDLTAAQIADKNPELAQVADKIANSRVYTTAGKVDFNASRKNLIELLSNEEFATQITTTSTLPYKSWYTVLRDLGKDNKLFNPAHMFTQEPMYLRGEGARIGVETGAYVPGNRAGIPALRSVLRQFIPKSADPANFVKDYVPRAGESAVDAVINKIYAATTPEAEYQVLFNAWRGISQRGLGEALFFYSTLTHGEKLTLEYMLGQELDRFASMYSGNAISKTEDRAYTTLSAGGMVQVAHKDAAGNWVPTVDENGIPITRRQAIDSSQLQAVKMPDYHEVKKQMAELVDAAAKYVREDGARANFRQYVQDYTQGDLSAKGMIPKEWSHLSSAQIAKKQIEQRFVGLNDLVDRYYNNRIFKPLALSTFGWATRVSFSELFLNTLRQGGIKQVAAHIAVGAGKAEAALIEGESMWGFKTANALNRRVFEGNVQLLARNALRVIKRDGLTPVGPMELTHLVAALMHIRLGLSSFALRTLGEGPMMDNAVRLLLLHDGHVVNPAFDSTRRVNDFVPMTDRRGGLAEGQAPGDPSGVTQEQILGREKQNMDKIQYQRTDGPRNADKFSVHTPLGDQYNAFIRDRQNRAISVSLGKENLLPAYVKAFDATGSHEQALLAAEKEALRILEANPERYGPGTFGRAGALNVGTTSGDPLIDWAHALALDRQGLVYKNENGIEYYDQKLANDIANKTVAARPDSFRAKYHDGHAPEDFNSVIGPDPLEKVTTQISLRRLADDLHHGWLGRTVNYLSRDATYLVEYTKELKALNKTVDSGALSKVQSEVLAETRATHTMARFVHNPYDKLKFEEGVRAWAPFYFAQNQAWRRALRLARVNPGAFEQYIRMALGYSHGISLLVGKNGTPIVSVPGASWVNQSFEGVVLKMLAGAHVISPGAAALGGAAVGFGLNPSTLQTVVPAAYDPTTNDASITNSFIPKLGPLVTTGLKFIENEAISTNLFGQANNAHAWAQRIMGPSEQFPLITDLFGIAMPNTVGQHVISAGTGFFFGDSANNAFTQSFATTQIETLKYYLTEGLAKNIKEHGPVAGSVSYLKWIVQPQNQQSVSQAAKTDATVLHLAEVVTAALAPVSVSTEAAFQPLLRAYQAKMKADGGNVIATNNWFISRYPGYLGLTLPMSVNGAGILVSRPETAKGVNWFLEPDNYKLQQVYPSLAGLLVPSPDRTGVFDQSAYAELLQLGWRQKVTSPQFLQSFVNNVANSIVWNYIDPVASDIYNNTKNYKGQSGYKGEAAFKADMLAQLQFIDPNYSPITSDTKQRTYLEEAIRAATPGSRYANRADVSFVGNLAYEAQIGLTMKDSKVKSSYSTPSPSSQFYSTWGPNWLKEMRHVEATGTWLNGNPVVPGMSVTENKALAKRLGYAISTMAAIMPTFTK